MKRHDFDHIQQMKESEASVDSKESLDEVEAYLVIDWSCTVALMSYLVHQRSKNLENQEMQRMHEVIHSKPGLWRTSSRTQSQRLVRWK